MQVNNNQGKSTGDSEEIKKKRKMSVCKSSHKGDGIFIVSAVS